MASTQSFDWLMKCNQIFDEIIPILTLSNYSGPSRGDTCKCSVVWGHTDWVQRNVTHRPHNGGTNGISKCMGDENLDSLGC